MARMYRNDGGALLAILIGASLALGLTATVAAGTVCRAESAAEPPFETEFLDPRGPERGPNELEWEVIRAYKPIESMTAGAPSLEVVDGALERLQTYAEARPRNPYIQELYLKGLRVAAYYAEEAGLRARAVALQARFDGYAVDFLDHEGVVLEAMRFRIQRLERDCLAPDLALAELEALTWRVQPTPEILGARSYGRRVAAGERCAVSG